MRVGIIYDDLYQSGGGEGLFFQLIKVFPRAEIFVPIISKSYTEYLSTRVVHKSKILSFVSKFGEFGYKVSSMLSVLWFESLFLGNYDLVISLSNRFSHCVITTPETKHVSIITSPFREIWEFPFNSSSQSFISLSNVINSILRTYNFYSSKRPDLLAPISSYVYCKLAKSWGIRGDLLNIISPPVELKVPKSSKDLIRRDYFLLVSRVNKWKYPYIKEALENAKKSNFSFIHVGKGPLLNRIKKDFMGYNNIAFLGHVSKQKLYDLYANAVAFLHPQVEDFGLTPLEALHFGVKVIALKEGGVLDYLNSNVSALYKDKSGYKKALNSRPYKVVDNLESSKILNLYSIHKFRYNLLQLIKSIQ